MQLKPLPLAVIYERQGKWDKQAILMEMVDLLRRKGYRVRITNPVLYADIDREKGVVIVLFEGTPNQDSICAGHEQDKARLIILPETVEFADLDDIIEGQVKPKPKRTKKQLNEESE